MYDNIKQDNTLYIASEICEHEYENRTDIERVEIINSVKKNYRRICFCRLHKPKGDKYT